MGSRGGFSKGTPGGKVVEGPVAKEQRREKNQKENYDGNAVTIELVTLEEVFNVNTLEMIEGDMPARAVRMIKSWAKKYNKDLVEMWKDQQYKQLPGLE